MERELQILEAQRKNTVVNDTSLSPDVRESECANRLENLKSSLKTAYKPVPENNYKSHVPTKCILTEGPRKVILKQATLCICLAQPRNLDRAPNFGNHGQGLLRSWPACRGGITV